MGHESLEARLGNLSHDCRVIDFLVIIQFTTPRIPRGMVVSNVLLVLPNPANDVTIHDGDMVNVKQ